MGSKEVKISFRKLSILMALALVVSLVLNLMLVDVKVKAANSLPDSFDGKIYQTPVRNQKQSNLCWAYSTIAALEASAVKQMGANKDTLDFSEFHLAYFTFAGGYDDLGLTNSDIVTFRSGDYLANGANPQYPMAVLSGGIGPVLESVVSTEQIFEPDGYVKSGAADITLDESLRRGSNAYDVDVVFDMLINNNSSGTSNRDAVKRAIMECGAVVTSYWSAEHDLYYKSPDGSRCCYYQDRKNSFDHGIAIVGWDDNFPKTNFHPSKQPTNNGAWLVKNSWGNDTKYTDNEGYFWISYEDASFGVIDNTSRNHAYGYKLRSAGQYKYNYQYDGGIIHEFENFGLTSTENIRYANVFTAAGNHRLDAITVHTDQGQANAPCTLKVYTDVDNNNPESGELAYTQNFSLSTNGFHTIKLTTPLDINENQRFSLVIYTDEYTHVAADRDYDFVDSNYSVNNHTEPNQSFVGKNLYGNIVWSDLDNENSHTYDDGQSLCIKALMNDRDSDTETIITLDNQSATIAGTDSITATKGQAMPTISVPIKTGFIFDGYYSKTNGGGTKYYNANGSSARNWDSDTITILYAKWKHKHEFSYSASGSDLIATCGNSGCDLSDNSLKLTIKAGNSTYSGNAYLGATISGDTTNWKSYTGLEIPTIHYTGSNGYNSTTPPTNVGSYVASIKVDSVSATSSFSINKATNNGPTNSNPGGGSSSAFPSSNNSSSTSSSNSSNSGKTTVTLSSDTSTNVNVQVSNNNVTIPAINESAINSIISNSTTTNEVKEVTIDLSKVNANVSSVTMNKNTVETIAKVLSKKENVKENLSVKLPNVTITLDDKAISAIAKQAKTDEIKIVVSNTTETKLNDSQKAAITKLNKSESTIVAQVFEAYVVSGTERISDFNGGNIRVSKVDFKLPAKNNTKFYHVYYLADNGDLVRCETWYEGGALHFDAGHF